jgi:hypothetical protein
MATAYRKGKGGATRKVAPQRLRRGLALTLSGAMVGAPLPSLG